MPAKRTGRVTRPITAQAIREELENGRRVLVTGAGWTGYAEQVDTDHLAGPQVRIAIDRHPGACWLLVSEIEDVLVDA